MKALAAILAGVLTAAAASQQPTPAPEMQRLGRLFVGNWTTAEQHEPGDIAPKGGVGHGSEKVSLGPGGMSLISDYRSVDPSGTFVAHTIMWWSAKEGGYRSVECYNRSTVGCEMGLWRWQGNDLVSRDEGSGEVWTWTDFTRTSHTVTLDAATDGGPMKRVMTIRYTRTGSTSH